LLVDTTTMKPVDMLPIPISAHQGDYAALEFSPDGTRLFGLLKGGGLLTWSLVDGQLLFHTLIENFVGPLVPGPYPDTVFLHFLKDKNLDKPYLFRVASGRTCGVLNTKVFRPAGGGRALALGAMAEVSPQTVPTQTQKDLHLYIALKPDHSPFGFEDLAAGKYWRLLYTSRLEGNFDPVKQKQWLATTAERPPAVRADRSGVTTAAPKPPAFPSIPMPPPRAGKPSPPGTVWPFWPAAFGDRTAAVIQSHPEKLGDTMRYDLRWRTFDLESGATDDNSVVTLWHWWQRDSQKRDERMEKIPPPPPVAALTADGRRLALLDPADPACVDVWEKDGKRIVGLNPYGTTDTRWVGWSTAGRLLTLGGGKLTGWNVPSGKAVFEVDGGYTNATQVAPGGGWVVAFTDAHADVLDTATGRCLARLGAGGPVGDWIGGPLLSPDGRLLVRLRHGGLVRPEEKLGTERKLAVHFWELTAPGPGQVREYGSTSWLPRVDFCGPRRLFAGYLREGELSDLDVGAIIARLALPENLQGAWFRTDPFGHMWMTTNKPLPRLPYDPGSWERVAYPTPAGGTGDPLADQVDLARAYRPGSVVRVEADYGNPERSLRAARRLAGMLTYMGYRIGPDGWTLRVTYKVADSKNVLTNGTVLPEIQRTTRLIPPAGVSAPPAETFDRWTAFHGNSKYITKRDVQFGANSEIVTHFDFKGLNPKEAMREEILDWMADASRFPVGLPSTVFVTPKGALRLPVEGKIRVA
ncbi:MAG: hypothetical protein ACRC7O_15225, partial [Fimbriiglobus sp.]